jgi:hypothetical protein
MFDRFFENEDRLPEGFDLAKLEEKPYFKGCK